jgi:hypothetical protein
MKKRKRRRAEPHPLASKAKRRPKGPALDRRRAPQSARITLQLPAELVERLRNAVYWTPGLTLTAVVTDALQNRLDKMETAHHGIFTQREQQLRRGRPPK